MLFKNFKFKIIFEIQPVKVRDNHRFLKGRQSKTTKINDFAKNLFSSTFFQINSSNLQEMFLATFGKLGKLLQK